jgi:hypothetical protein
MPRTLTTKPLVACARLEWLVRFAETDVERAGHFGRLVRETLAFLRTAGSRASAESEECRNGNREYPRAAGPDLRDPDPRPALRLLKERVRAHLESWCDDRCVPIDLRVRELVRRNDGQVCWRVGGGVVQQLDGAVALTFVLAGDRLHPCPGHRCRRLFVKRRKQLYCTPVCNQRTRAARYAEKYGVTTVLTRQRARQKRRSADETAQLLGDAMPVPKAAGRRSRTRRFASRPRRSAKALPS